MIIVELALTQLSNFVFDPMFLPACKANQLGLLDKLVYIYLFLWLGILLDERERHKFLVIKRAFYLQS